MPMYTFICNKCGRVERRLVKYSEVNKQICPVCGSKMNKIIGNASIQFKGKGYTKVRRL